MIPFIVGVIIGAFFGMFIIALVKVGDTDD
jgi:hypothetical protein